MVIAPHVSEPVAINWRMPKPSPLPSEPESRKPPQKVAPTPEQIAKIVTAKLATPVGMPDKAELPLKVVLPRAVIERLMVRASRENYPSLAEWVQAVLASRRGRARAGRGGPKLEVVCQRCPGETRKSRRGARLHCSPPPLNRLPVSRVHQRGECRGAPPPRQPYRSVQVPISLNGFPPLNVMALESLHFAAAAFGAVLVRIRSVTLELSPPPAGQAVPFECR
jgi:hypothetical protein